MHGFEQISTAEFFFFFNVELQTYLERLFGVDKTKKKKNNKQKNGQKYIAIQLLTTGHYRIITDWRKGGPAWQTFAVVTLSFQTSNSWWNGLFDIVHSLP